jgi:hypothetical protein
MIPQNLLKLRSGKDLILFDKIEKLYVGFKLNTNEKMVCWKRLISEDKRNWVCWNEYLSLKDVDGIINDLKTKSEKLNLSTVII